jgi:hypothetical protein
VVKRSLFKFIGRAVVLHLSPNTSKKKAKSRLAVNSLPLLSWRCNYLLEGPLLAVDRRRPPPPSLGLVDFLFPPPASWLSTLDTLPAWASSFEGSLETL